MDVKIWKSDITGRGLDNAEINNHESILSDSLYNISLKFAINSFGSS